MWVSSSSVEAVQDTAPVSTPIRALHGLRETHAAATETALSLLGCGWSVERHDTYDGHLILMLSPADEDARCFVLHGSADGIHLDAMGDEYEQLGRFDSVASAIQSVCGHLAGIATPARHTASAETRQPGCAA